MTVDTVSEASDVPADESGKAALYQSLGCVGCGLVVVAIFVFLGFTIFHASKNFSTEPDAVLATLQAVVPCDVPKGYRPLNSMDAAGERIAILAPDSYDGETITFDLPLLIQVWSWTRPEREMNLTVLMRFWEGRVADRFGEVKSIQLGDPRPVTLRGAAASADVRWILCEEGKLRLVSVWLDDRTAVTFIGVEEGFDDTAQAAFLASIR